MKRDAIRLSFATLLIAVACALMARTAYAASSSTATPPVKTAASTQQAYETRIELDPFYPQMSAAATVLRGRKLVDFISEAEQGADDRRLEVIAYWLREHTFLEHDSAKVNSLYFMSYADVLYQRAQLYKNKGDMDSYMAFFRESMQSLYAYEALASADAKRCRDKTAIDGVRDNTMLGRFNRALPAYRLFSNADFEAIGNIAVLIEKRYADRPKNDDICGMGAGMLMDIAKQPGTTKKYVDDPDAGGEMRTMLVPPENYTYQPAYISDADWQKERQKSDVFLLSDWLRRYVVLKDAAQKKADAAAKAESSEHPAQ